MLTFDYFQTINRARCNAAFPHNVDDWSPGDWALAIAGEAGELANVLKKVRRGDLNIHDIHTIEMIAEETADVVTYCDLLMTRLGRVTSAELIAKFNKVSERRGCSIIIDTI